MASYDVGTIRVEDVGYVSHAIPLDAPKPEGLFPLRVDALCGVKVNRFGINVTGGDFAAMIKKVSQHSWLRICPICERLTTREDDHA